MRATVSGVVKFLLGKCSEVTLLRCFSRDEKKEKLQCHLKMQRVIGNKLGERAIQLWILRSVQQTVCCKDRLFFRVDMRSPADEHLVRMFLFGRRLFNAASEMIPRSDQ